MDDKRPIDDCFFTDKDRLTHSEAIAILKANTPLVVGTQTVSLQQAAGRIVSQAIKSPMAVPRADNSAVDGYAFRHADYSLTGGFFPVTALLAAGHPTDMPLAPGAAARIFTGAWMPEGADTVAMQEDCETHEQDGEPFVVIPPELNVGANRRKAGEDLNPGDGLFEAGDRLRPQDIAAAASVGQAELAVYQRLSVALFSTGDEVTEPGQPLEPGGLYDANKSLLQTLLNAAGADVTDCGSLADDASVVAEALSRAAQTYDAILTSGGASRGVEDHVVTTLDKLGTRHMWQIAIKPGRPMTFGQIGGQAGNQSGADGDEPSCILLGLPGNPVAAFVCFLLYARPTLMAMAGAKWRDPETYSVAADFTIEAKKPDRREFLRGRLVRAADGTLTVRRFDRDGSGLITGLREADGLIEIPENTRTVRAGEPVSFMPFSQFGI